MLFSILGRLRAFAIYICILLAYREDGSTVISGREMKSNDPEIQTESTHDEKEDSLSDIEDEEDDESQKSFNPLLIVTNVMPREEIELKETVFRYVD